MTRHGSCLMVYLVLAGAVGCSRAEPMPEAVLVRDSAGIRIVESNTPAWAISSDGWVVDPEPEIEIPGDFGEPEHYLFEVGYATRLSDGSIVVGNQGTQELLFFDRFGHFVRAVGGPGDGPGEFQRLYGMFRCEADRLMVLELSRMSILDREGRFLRAMPLLPESREVDAVSPDCSAGLFVGNVIPRPEVAPGINDTKATLFWTGFEDGERDTVASVVRDQFHIWNQGGELLSQWLPFSERSHWAASGEEVIVGHGTDFELAVLGRSGRLRQLIRWKAVRSPLTSRDRDDLSNERRDILERFPEEERYWPPIERIPLPDTKPAYTRIVVSDEGAIWLQQPGKWPEHSQEWWVFSSAGVWLGTVTMPARLHVLAIDGDFVVGAFRDAMDVESIRLHRVHKLAPG